MAWALHIGRSPSFPIRGPEPLMSSTVPGADRIGKLPPAAQWGALLVLSFAIAALLEMVHIPAALLLGPMLAGILLGTNGTTIKAPRPPYFAAQAIIGCLIARSITGDILLTVLRDWQVFVGSIVAILGVTSFTGWLMSWLKVLPGTTAVWGTSPGAAAAMMLLAESYGADVRLVAFMLYLRVVFVAITATLVARLWVGSSGAHPPEIVWFPPVDWIALAETVAIALIGAYVGKKSGMPAGGLLMPMIVATALHVPGWVKIELPEWLMVLCYAFLGWNIGLAFTRPVLKYAARALPQILLATVVTLAFCGLLAVLLHIFVGVDPLTAYLSTSPGGMDSVAIIAANSRVDMSFVMAMQTTRFIAVIALGPSIARFIAARIPA
jgi:membrane AbrB-like protein